MSLWNRNSRGVLADTTSDLGAGMHPRISIKGGRFSLVDGGGIRTPWPALVLPVIIIGANPKKSKIYFDERYDPNDDGKPPLCYSDNGVAPSANAGEPQARTCVECPHYGWGSATSEITGKKTKACADKKKLAVIVCGDSAMHAYELQIPPTGLKELNTYSHFIGSMNTPDGSRRADLPDVVTLVSFDPDSAFQLKFQHWGWIDSCGPDGNLHYDQQGQPLVAPDGGEGILDYLDRLWESTVVEELVGLTDRPWAGAGALTGPAPAPQVAYEPQGHGGALQRGSHPQHAAPVPQGPFSPPPHAQAQQPRAMVQPAPPATTGRGGARAGSGRKPKAAEAPASNVAPFMPPRSVPPVGEKSETVGPVPSFLQQPAAAAPQNGAAPLADGAAPPDAMQAAINAAFNLPTR